MTNTFASSAGNLAYEGSQYLDLVGEGGTGSLSQSFATVAGHVYTLTLAYSHNLFSGLAAASGSVTVGSLADLLVHSGGSNSNLNWQTYTANFIAGAGTSSTLTFTNLTGAGNEGLFLDAVSIQQAVPEASTWAQLLIGFALVGGAMSARRRRGIAIPAAV